MDDQTQNNNDLSSGFLIKDKKGNIKKVQDDIIGEYQVSGSNITTNPPVFMGNKSNITSTPVKSDDSKSVEASEVDTVSKEMADDSISNIQPINKVNNQFPQPSAPVSSQASFVGDPDEEEEIRKHQEELNKILEDSNISKSVSTTDDLVNEILKKFDLHFDNDILAKRFQKILESRIKHIRNSIETAEVLHRSSKVGGLELPEDKANEIVKYVDEHSKDAINTNQIKEKEAVQETPTQSAEIKQADFSQAPPAFIPIPKKKEPEPQPQKEIKETMVSNAEVKPKENTNIPVKESVEEPVKINQEKPVEDLYKRSATEEMSKMASIRQQTPQRPQVMDIRQPSSVTGPVEELMQIDLKEFRRMGNNPGESTEKILEKMYLLEEESWNIRMDGIAAWQKSPLNQQYLKVGRESLKQNKPVIEVIDSQEDSNKLILHFQEFLAVNDLNSKLVI